jgi:hypothetical protein
MVGKREVTGSNLAKTQVVLLDPVILTQQTLGNTRQTNFFS